MAFVRVSNNKKHTHCTCISHSITVFIELHTIHKRHRVHILTVCPLNEKKWRLRERNEYASLLT